MSSDIGKTFCLCINPLYIATMGRKLLFVLFFCSLSGFEQEAADRTAVDFLKKFGTDFIGHLQNGKPESIQPYFADNIRLMPEFQKIIIRNCWFGWIGAAEYSARQMWFVGDEV